MEAIPFYLGVDANGLAGCVILHDRIPSDVRGAFVHPSSIKLERLSEFPCGGCDHTDRRLLDRQLQGTVSQFEQTPGIVVSIDQHSGQLAAALSEGRHIIITTLQKFPFVIGQVATLAERNFAVIIDEAHSSQTGEAARKMRMVLSDSQNPVEATEEIEEDWEDELGDAALSAQPNLTFVALTATPKFKTIEIFGTPGIDGKPGPFHVYSMRQAIEEKFILDVLQNYTTYGMFRRLQRDAPEDPEVDPRKARAAIARFVSLHPYNIAQKTEVIVEHFRNFSKDKIGGRAKAMVVTRSRLQAVRYKLAFDRYIREHAYTDIHALVAFSVPARQASPARLSTRQPLRSASCPLP